MDLSIPEELESARRQSIVIVLLSSGLACYLLVAMLRVLRGGSGHEGALARIAVATTAQHTHQLTTA